MKIWHELLWRDPPSGPAPSFCSFHKTTLAPLGPLRILHSVQFWSRCPVLNEEGDLMGCWTKKEKSNQDNQRQSTFKTHKTVTSWSLHVETYQAVHHSNIPGCLLTWVLLFVFLSQCQDIRVGKIVPPSDPYRAAISFLASLLADFRGALSRRFNFKLWIRERFGSGKGAWISYIMKSGQY